MKNGDISNEQNTVYGIDFDSIFRPLEKLSNFHLWMIKVTKGRWLAWNARLANGNDLLRPRPGVLPYIRDLYKFCDVTYYLVNSQMSAKTALMILQRFNFPVQTIKEVYRAEDLRDELGYDMVNVFYTMNTDLYPRFTGPMGVLIFDWRNVPPTRGPIRTS